MYVTISPFLAAAQPTKLTINMRMTLSNVPCCFEFAFYVRHMYKQMLLLSTVDSFVFFVCPMQFMALDRY